MADEINKTADWAPGTLDKTRKNIGDISEKDAAAMAKKLGGQVMYERSSNSSGGNPKAGRIVRQPSSSNSGSSGSSSSSGIATAIASIHLSAGFLCFLHQISIPISPPRNPPW